MQRFLVGDGKEPYAERLPCELSADGTILIEVNGTPILDYVVPPEYTFYGTVSIVGLLYSRTKSNERAPE